MGIENGFNLLTNKSALSPTLVHIHGELPPLLHLQNYPKIIRTVYSRETSIFFPWGDLEATEGSSQSDYH